MLLIVQVSHLTSVQLQRVLHAEEQTEGKKKKPLRTNQPLYKYLCLFVLKFGIGLCELV